MGRITVGTATDQTVPGVPKQYAQFTKVFSEEESHNFPPVRIWDHAIELKPGAPATIPGKIYSLLQTEQRKPMNSSKDTSNKEPSARQRDHMQPPSSTSKRKMANYTPYKTTADSTNGQSATNHHYPSFPSLSTVSEDAPSTRSSTYDGDTTMSESKTETSGKQLSSPMKDCSNQQSCSSD
jgi:hypothetical protein